MKLFLRAWTIACVSCIGDAQTVVFADDFEDGLRRWTKTGLWNHERPLDPCGSFAAPFPDGEGAAYYGIEHRCTYDTGSVANRGSITTDEPVYLSPIGARAKLKFETYFCTEPSDSCPGYDLMEILISADQGQTWDVAGNPCPFPKVNCWNQWWYRQIDLSSYLGGSILLRFHFDTRDAIGNAYLGWLVDDVRIELEAGDSIGAGQCPCANYPSYQGGGCQHSAGGSAVLAASGYPSLNHDEVQLDVRGLPRSELVVHFLEGVPSNGHIFGDGSLMLRGDVVRLGSRQSHEARSLFPGPDHEQPLSSFGRVPPSGGARAYQVRYRDTDDFCTPAQFNWSNGYRITWVL